MQYPRGDGRQFSVRVYNVFPRRFRFRESAKLLQVSPAPRRRPGPRLRRAQVLRRRFPGRERPASSPPLGRPEPAPASPRSPRSSSPPSCEKSPCTARTPAEGGVFAQRGPRPKRPVLFPRAPAGPAFLRLAIPPQSVPSAASERIARPPNAAATERIIGAAGRPSLWLAPHERRHAPAAARRLSGSIHRSSVWRREGSPIVADPASATTGAGPGCRRRAGRYERAVRPHLGLPEACLVLRRFAGPSMPPSPKRRQRFAGRSLPDWACLGEGPASRALLARLRGQRPARGWDRVWVSLPCAHCMTRKECRPNRTAEKKSLEKLSERKPSSPSSPNSLLHKEAGPEVSGSGPAPCSCRRLSRRPISAKLVQWRRP